MEHIPLRQELAARQQIREHLTDHVQKYLAIDSNDYTIQEAEQLLSGILLHVPLTGPTDIGPPADFVDLLLDNDNALVLSLPEDRLSISAAVFNWLKGLKRQIISNEHAQAARALSRFALDETTYSLSPHHPLDLVISRRSNGQTPSIGTGASAHVLPATLPELGRELNLRPVAPPVLQDPPVNQEQLLSLRISLAAETRSFLKDVLSSLRSSTSAGSRASAPRAITDFLCAEESTPEVVDRRMSPPLFRRVAPSLARQKQSLRGNDLSDLSSLIGGKVDIEEDEMDYVQESFKLMDGWKAIPELSSSTAHSDVTSPASSQRKQLSKHWALSSEGPNMDLDQWKMEEVEFPRSRQVGQPASNQTVAAPGFMCLKEVIENPIPGDAQFPSKYDYRPRDTASLSVMGAATSVDGDKMDLDGTDDLLVKVYKDVQAHDPFSVILNEKIDQKDSWFMELPDLPEPCGQKSSLPPLPHLSVMVAPPVKKGERPSLYDELADDSLNFNLRLRKVGGLRIPNLSWSPSIQGEGTIPTTEGVARVKGDLDLERESVDFLQEARLLCLVPPKPSTENFQISSIPTSRTANHVEHGAEAILLTRAELRRLGSIQQIPEALAAVGEHQAEIELDHADDTDVEMIVGDKENGGPLASELVQPQVVSQVACRSLDFDRGKYGEPSPPKFIMETAPLSASYSATNARPAAPPSLLPPSNTIPVATNTSTHSQLTLTKPTRLIGDSNRNRLHHFLSLRGRPQPEEVLDQLVIAQNDEVPSPHSSPDCLRHPPVIPEEVSTHCTFSIDRTAPRANRSPVIYKYIASFDMIQKRGMCHHLTSDPIGIYLVERLNVTDVDLIVDPGAAIIYVTLAALPAETSALVERISKISPAYSSILLIFEAYPPSHSRTARLDSEPIRKDTAAPYAFSPPILKAFTHLRRSLIIAQSTGEKLTSCRVDVAFALDEEEAALYGRMFGDARVEECARDGNAAMSGPWDGRDWLSDDPYEGENELALFEGLNVFAAVAMLRLVNLDSIIDEMTPEQRLMYFANEVGRDRVVRFNELIETRLRALELSPAATGQ